MADNKNDSKSLDKRIKRYTQSFKMAQRDRLTAKERMELKLSKQKKILDKLQEDRQDLINKTFVTEQARKIEIEFLQNFTNYIREKAYLENEVKNIREEMKELDKRNKLLGKEIKRKTVDSIKKKALSSGTDVSAERAEALLYTLENKLSQSRMCLNRIILTCKEYRRDIDDCFTERQKFRGILDNVTAKLRLGKACMMDMLEQASVATAKRELAKDRTKKLVEYHRKMSAKQAHSYRELDGNMNVLIDRAIFQSIKIQSRVLHGTEAKKQLADLVKRQEIENQVMHAKLALNHLKHFFGTNDHTEITKIFNYYAFHLVTILKNAAFLFDDSDKYHKKNTICLFTCDKLKEETTALIENEKKKLEAAYAKYSSLRDEIVDLDKKLDHTRTLKEFTILRLNMMFNKAGGSFANFSKLLGDNTIINTNNYNLMMKEIERRIVKLVGTLILVESVNQIDDLPLKRYLLHRPKEVENTRYKMRFYGIGVDMPCPNCIEAEQFGLKNTYVEGIEPYDAMKQKFLENIRSENNTSRLHSVSCCNLPGSRRILQQRFVKLGN